MSDTVIEIKNLSKRIGNHFLIKNINWQVQRGEHWVLFGGNGSGKTTLLSVIAGFGSYDDGCCRVLGEEITSCDLSLLRKKIGWISGSYFDKQYRNETVMEIILSGKSGTLGLRPGITNADILKAQKLLKSCQLSHKKNSLFRTLSKGEQQNILICRALIAEPEILIMDEPCTGLDIMARERVFRWLNHYAELEQITLIYVTHYIEEILDIFPNCFFLKNGMVYRQGITDELVTDDVMSDFFGHPIKIKHENNHRVAIFEDSCDSV